MQFISRNTSEQIPFRSENFVEITFDALPEFPVSGTLESVSDSATKRLDWSKAAYFEGTVRFEDSGLAEMGLLPGMSALVEVMQ